MMAQQQKQRNHQPQHHQQSYTPSDNHSISNATSLNNYQQKYAPPLNHSNNSKTTASKRRMVGVLKMKHTINLNFITKFSRHANTINLLSIVSKLLSQPFTLEFDLL